MAIMSGTLPGDYETLLTVRQAALEEIYAEDSELGAEFAEICGQQHDYLWDNIHQALRICAENKKGRAMPGLFYCPLDV